MKTYGTALDCIKDFGGDEEEIPGIGSNAKMDEFRAAMGLCNLKYIPEAISQRKRIAERYFLRKCGRRHTESSDDALLRLLR